MVRTFIVLAFVVLASLTSGSAATLAAQQPAAVQASTDFSGTWVGTIAIPQPGMRFDKKPLRVDFTHTGSKLTGVLGTSPAERLPILAGLVQVTKFGTSISFDLKEGELVLHVELRPDDGVLRGAARIDGTRATAAIELRREPTAEKKIDPKPLR